MSPTAIFAHLPMVLLRIFCALTLLPAMAVAQIGGIGTYSFLNLSPSARNAAMGGNQISIMDGDLDLVYLNPALLDSSMHNYLVTDFTNYYGDINYGYVGYARTMNKVGNMAFGLKYVNYGSFTMADEYGQVMGSFSANDMVAHTTWAKPFGKYFSTGISGKLIYSNYAEFTSVGLAFDLAAVFHHKETNWTVSLVGRNFGSQLVPYVGGSYQPLPMALDLGISKKLKYVPLRLSMIIRDLQQPDLTYRDPTNSPPEIDPLTGEVSEYSVDIGDAIMRHLIFSAELTIAKRIMVRMGYNYGRRQELKVNTLPATVGFSWGLGLKVNRFVISYGRATYHLAGGTNHISISTNLGEHVRAPRKAKPDPDHAPAD